MSEEVETEEAPKKKSKLPLILGVVGALAAGGGGFFATYSGMILGNEEKTEDTPKSEAAGAPKVAFIPLDPLVVSLGRDAKNSHLRFSAQLEVEQGYEQEVEFLKPRVIDVMNGYLRALRAQDIEDPAALVRLRSQILRRIQVVTGEGRVRDLLVTEFVLN